MRNGENVEPYGVVLVGMDGSPSSIAALLWAARQARVTRARLRVVTSWGYPQAYGPDIMITSDWRPDQEARRAQSGALADAGDLLDGIEIETVVTEGQTAGVLVEESKQADVLVVGSRGHGELTGMLLGSVSEYCATHADCPVVVVRPHHAPVPQHAS